MGRYRSLSGTWVDPEKQERSYNEDDDINGTSDAHGLLTPHSPALRSHGRKTTYAYALPRRRFGRYFTIAITVPLVLLMLYLIRSSAVSRAELKSGVHKPPPPPPTWEQFPFLKRFHGGIRTLVSRQENEPEWPVEGDVEVQRIQDAAKAQEEVVERRDSFPQGERFDGYAARNLSGFDTPTPCYIDEDKKLQIPQLLAYKGVPSGFPDPATGSHRLLNIRDDVCFERYGRLGPYGFGYSKKFGGSSAGVEGEREGAEAVWGGELEIDYREVNWGAAQERCAKKNAKRFKTQPSGGLNHFHYKPMGGVPAQPAEDVKERQESEHAKPLLSRTAVLIRTWHDYEYDAEDMFYLRALVNELSLQSGSEYVIHFLIHVKDDNMAIWSDEETYQKTLDDALPAEFRGMGTLWSERQMGLIYGGLPESNYRDLGVYGVYRSSFLPVQYFAHMHPEYEHFWNWETDVRYTGHFGHLFTQVSQWAREQPRKGLWERNSRFYVPSEHGSWDDFRHMVRVQIEHGTASKQNVYGKLTHAPGGDDPTSKESLHAETPVWGPMPPTGESDHTVDDNSDPQPPTSYEKDKYDWGVGEEADLITFNPLFDPQNTDWLLNNDITGYESPETTPRRAAIITASRLSRRLLETMHRETALQRHIMFSEMWPASCALHHGYKAVYVPHPVYIDRAWPSSYLAAVLNNGAHGAAGGARTSVFSEDHQHNFRGVTWYYNSGFAPNLWRRWLGYKVDNDGGEEWEIANEGRMCLPAMLLHPVKQVDLVYPHEEWDTGLY